MRIAVIPNCKTISGPETGALCEALSRAGAEVRRPDECVVFPDNADDGLMAWCDVALALGGDGTIIHTAKRAAKFDKPVLGVNCGKLGFMAGVEFADSAWADDLIAGKYHIENRMMLHVRVEKSDGRVIACDALNEAAVTRGGQARMIRLNIRALADGDGGEPVLSYHADGVIIATPTGSTAYALSAGGPIIDPAMECLLLTPVCPHSLFARSYIFRGGETLQVTVDAPEDTDAIITIDGEQGFRMEPGDAVLLSRAAHIARLVKMNRVPFYDILNRKLIDRR